MPPSAAELGKANQTQFNMYLKKYFNIINSYYAMISHVSSQPEPNQGGAPEEDDTWRS